MGWMGCQASSICWPIYVLYWIEIGNGNANSDVSSHVLVQLLKSAILCISRSLIIATDTRAVQNCIPRCLSKDIPPSCTCVGTGGSDFVRSHDYPHTHKSPTKLQNVTSPRPELTFVNFIVWPTSQRIDQKLLHLDIIQYLTSLQFKEIG